MDNANYEPQMLLDVVAGNVLDQDPFVLVDVGCGLGIDPAWRLFGRHLHVHAFDAQVAEVERLRAEEENENVRYDSALIGLPDDHPIARRRRELAVEATYFEPNNRTSAAAAAERAADAGSATFYETNDWLNLDLATQKFGLAEILRSQGVEGIDFVKTDTDGADLEVLLSFEDMIRSSGVLGFMVETPFTGPADPAVHTFHNVDRLLKHHGFLLCALSVNRYSRAALPAQFKYPILAQTVTGQAMWGDLVYLREGSHPDYAQYGDLSATKLLKLASLYELFLAPDCAAEILVTHRERLASLVDVDNLLDTLTPPLDGERLSYREYLAAFEDDPTRFYPHVEPELAELPVEPEPAPTTVQRAKHLVARALGR
jgi:FkbM family methyltransferase